MTDKTEALPEKLRRLAENVTAWGNIEDCWSKAVPPGDYDFGLMFVGHYDKETGERYPLFEIDADTYGTNGESVKLAEFYAAANPAAVLEILDRIATLEAQLSARQAAPDGWKLVPVEPTEAMIKAGNTKTWVLPCNYCWSEMLSAAPPPPEREPLTDEQILRLFIEMYGQEPVDITEFAEVCGRVEKHHGIGATNDNP